MLFFFSSRRRHTRSKRDWSSDVCSSDLFWQMEQSIDGISEACNILKTPVVSGNVSLYNQSKGNDILPTPIIGMRSEERRVGKECRSRRAPAHERRKNTDTQ